MMEIINGKTVEMTAEREEQYWRDNPPEPSEIERLAAVEDALVELAGVIAGGGDPNG